MDSQRPGDVNTREQPVQQAKCDLNSHELPSTWRAAVMYALSLLFLCLTGCFLPHGGVVDPISAFVMQSAWIKWALCLTWIAIVIESVAGFRIALDAGKPALTRLVIVCLVPPFRMTISPALPNGYIWLPGQGWLRTGKQLLERLESRMALPMLCITVLILPVMGAEMFFKSQVEHSLPLMLTVYLLTAWIWIAFAFEFILLISVAERKVDFCKAHWLNMVIILLPLVAFLRTLQLFRFLRVANASKLMRAYRLRGVTTRAMRIALIFSLFERLRQRNPHQYCLHLEEKIQEKEAELDVLKAKLNDVRSALSSTDHTP